MGLPLSLGAHVTEELTACSTTTSLLVFNLPDRQGQALFQHDGHPPHPHVLRHLMTGGGDQLEASGFRQMYLLCVSVIKHGPGTWSPYVLRNLSCSLAGSQLL